MCVEESRFPSKQDLKDAEDMNSHGGSIAWLNKDGTKSYRKGIKAKQINRIINKELIPKGISTAIIHFRIASVGGVKKKLNHPFEISGKVELNMENMNTTKDLLFHNGTWDSYDTELINYLKSSKTPQVIPRGAYSDSRIMAYLAHKLGHKGMAKLVTGWNKVAILTKKGIVKYGSGWCKVNGVPCSNDYFTGTGFQSFGVTKTNYKPYNNAFDYTTTSTPYLSEDEQVEMTNLKDLYGVTEDEVYDMLADGTSIYDIAQRLDTEEEAMIQKMNFEDEIAYYNRSVSHEM